MKILVAAYTVLAIAAGARAAVQLSTHAGEAPVQYALSAAAAAVYLVLAIALRRPERGARWLSSPRPSSWSASSASASRSG